MSSLMFKGARFVVCTYRTYTVSPNYYEKFPHVVERELGKSGHLFFPAVGCLLLPIIASPNSSCIFRPGDVRVGRSPATWRGDRPLSSPPETYLPSRRERMDSSPEPVSPSGRTGGQDLAYFRTRVSYKIFCAKADDGKS